MTTVHIIEDNDKLRRLLLAEVKRTVSGLPEPYSVRGWKFVWELVGSWDARSSTAPARGDLAVCDLFAIEYYAARANQKPRFFAKVASVPRSPENIKRAAMDSIKTYFPTILDHGVRVVVFSYVFAVLEDAGHTDGVEAVRNELRALSISDEDIIAKPRRQLGVSEFEPVLHRVGRILSASGASG